MATKATKGTKDIEGKVVKVLYEQPAGTGTVQLRIVRWIVDGKDTGALLEKRNFFTSFDSDQQKMGKAKGLNKDDIKIIVDNLAEIQGLMG